MRRFLLLVGSVLVVAALMGCGSTKPASPGVTGRTGSGSLEGRVTAGPTCPVAAPGTPGCEDRPVPGAVLIVRDADGDEVARATTDADGRYQIDLPPGHYTVEPQPVDGLMGTAAPSEIDVPEPGAAPASLDFSYDTGIRN